MKFNRNILIGGSLLILLIFGIGWGFLWLTYLRQDALSDRYATPTPFPTANPQQRVTFENEADVPVDVREEIEAQRILLKGAIIDSNPAERTLEVARSIRPDETELVTASFRNVREILCWPEFFETNDGTQIAIADAYFPVTPNSQLFIRGEEVLQVSDLSDAEMNNIFADNSVVTIANTDNQGSAVISQLAIVGCLDSN